MKIRNYNYEMYNCTIQVNIIDKIMTITILGDLLANRTAEFHLSRGYANLNWIKGTQRSFNSYPNRIWMPICFFEKKRIEKLLREIVTTYWFD